MTKFFLKHKKNIIYCISAFFLICMLTVANILANFIMPASSDSEEICSPSFELYLISLTKSQIEKESTSHASDFQSMGAGGFIWEIDQYHHIISSAYLNKADAELVQGSIKLNQGIDTSLVQISFPSYCVYGNFSVDEGKALSNLLQAPINFYGSIYDIAISLDTNVSNEVGAKLNVNSALNDYSKAIADFNTLFSGTLENNLQEIYTMATKGYEIAQKLALGEKKNEEQNYSSLLKYRYLEMLNLYYNFVV